MLKPFVQLPAWNLGQGDETPRPRKRHARSDLPRNVRGAQRVCEAGVACSVEGRQSREPDVGDRELLAGTGRLEDVTGSLVLLTREVRAHQLPKAAAQQNARGRGLQLQPSRLEVGDAGIEQPLCG